MENLIENICIQWFKFVKLVMATCKWLIFSLCMFSTVFDVVIYNSLANNAY